jgi:hypothetical protein
MWYTDEDTYHVKLGIDWFSHKHYNKKFKPWFGFTINFYIFSKLFAINFVDDYDAYDKKVHYWRYKVKK